MKITLSFQRDDDNSEVWEVETSDYEIVVNVDGSLTIKPSDPSWNKIIKQRGMTFGIPISA
jgi:hypothetical protein